MRPVEITVPVNHLADSSKPDAGIKMNMESGEAHLQKGAHDKDISASVQFKRVW